MRLRLLLVLPVLLAACGASGDGGRAASVPAVQPTAEAAATGPKRVRIEDFEFGPRTVRVRAGRKVVWTDRDEANHTVTFSKGPGDLGNVDPGKRVSVRFKRPGRYAYVCQYHPSMKGTVVVR